MGSKQPASKQRRQTLSVALNLRTKLTSAKLEALLKSEQAQAEGLFPYKSGALRASFNEWDHGKLKGVTQADVDEFHNLAMRLAGLTDSSTPVAPVDIPDNSVLQCQTETRITPEERAPNTDNADIQCQHQVHATPEEQAPGTDNDVIHSQTDANNTDIQCPTGTELPTTDTLHEVRKMLAEIEIAERPGDTAPGRKSKLQTQLIAARFPVDLIAKLDALGGRRSHHLERALMLYLKAMDTPDPDAA